ncbi:hypothetical protein AVEN_104065-1 [Araneus ventricosus]|uniref:CCHC-type domain-containing protein n=1 Tax=Araneus ventricosus TaxID=182803 RepID=A0A4Y2KDR0_ARAVE|nr:hypothetical protein AVEN_104065-1 [Araneus ventricosus]
MQPNTVKKWPPKKSNDGNSNMRRNTKCFRCGQWGHVSGNCDEAQEYQKNQSSSKAAIDLKANWAFLTNQEKENNSILWILDSGSTEHMTSDRSKFTSLTNYSSIVEVTNSEKIQVTGTDDITISVSEESEKRRNITLANVLYVPYLGRNLLSIDRMEERGFKMEFAHGEANILSENYELVLKGRKKTLCDRIIQTSSIHHKDNN